MQENDDIPQEIHRRIADDERHLISLAEQIGEKQLDFMLRGWAAGFFDGEGHVATRPDGRIEVSIDHVVDDLADLFRFKRVTNVGRISELNRDEPGKRKKWRWSATSQKDVHQVWDQIGLFLTKTKSDQFAAAIALPRDPSKFRGTYFRDVE